MTREGQQLGVQNRGHGMLSATASLGMIVQWNVDEGPEQIVSTSTTARTWSRQAHATAVGIVSSSVRNKSDLR
jgi:26S proteasome regulatory subunit N1